MKSLIKINRLTLWGKSISISGRKVYVDGDLTGGEIKGDTLHIVVEGDVASLSCDGSATIRGDVKGNVRAGGSVNCGDIGGNADAGGSIKADSLKGNAKAGGSIKIG